MVYSSRGKSLPDLNLTVNNTKILRVEKTKFLGVTIDSHLSWTPHIDYISKKISRSLGILLKARKKLDTQTIISLYYSFTYPYLIYCNQVWGKTYSTHLQPLHLLHKKVIRIITDSAYLAHTEALMKKIMILNLTSINIYTRSILLYNYVEGNLPSNLNQYYTFKSEIF